MVAGREANRKSICQKTKFLQTVKHYNIYLWKSDMLQLFGMEIG